MTTYVALLRGINVGKAKAVSMADLRDLLTRLGYEDVRTHLRSGNAVFATTAKAATVERAISDAIGAELDLSVKTLVRTKAELAGVVAANTLPTTNGARLQVYFLDSAPTKASLGDLDLPGYEPELLQVGKRELYLWCPDGVTSSALVKTITEKRLGRVITARNWNTVTKLLALADAV